MVFSSVGLCLCGEEIWVEYTWNGEVYRPRFFTVDQEEITHCPACGKELNEEELASL